MFVIAGVQSKPADYDEYDSKLSYGLKYAEQQELDDSEPVVEQSEDSEEVSHPYYPEIYTNTDIRTKRQTKTDEKDLSIDVNRAFANASDEAKRPERKTNDESKVELRGLISAIESHLVSTAQEVNANLRKRRSQPFIEVNQFSNNTSNETDDSLDVNKNLFDDVFNYTRLQRETETQSEQRKIPLHSLVKAVESKIINSAQILNDPLLVHKRDVSIQEIELHRSIPSADESDTSVQPIIKVEKLTVDKNSDLNLLNPITFKPSTSSELATTESNSDEIISTTESTPQQHTNFTVVKSSASVRVVPGADTKIVHVQHQQIQQTVFHSSLAIFPTIPPHTINAPIPQVKTTVSPTTDSIETTTNTLDSKTTNSNLIDHQTLLLKTQKLKEKIAEVQADPIILSQI